MPQGLQVWDASGNLVLDVSDRVGKFLGVTTITAGVNGSVTHAGFALGQFFFMVTPLSAFPTYRPSMAFNPATNTLSWDWQGRPGVNCSLRYGVY